MQFFVELYMSMVLFGNWLVKFFIPCRVVHFIGDAIVILCIAVESLAWLAAREQLESTGLNYIKMVYQIK
jgi:hypothetical protein